VPSILAISRRSLPLAAASTILCLLVFVTVQQSLRTGANDPQIQMAEDAARALERGEAIEQVVPATKAEIERSLAPFLMIYDADGRPLAGSGTLNGRPAAPPAGVFTYVSQHRDERVTWQPERGVRLAAVVFRTTASPAAFVLAARSLREVEKREAYMQNVAAGALVATFCVILLLTTLFELAAPRRP
jgi:hypothetical protein